MKARKNPELPRPAPVLTDLEADVIALFVQLSRALGQNSVEIAVTGARDLTQAEASLRDELPTLIRIAPTVH